MKTFRVHKSRGTCKIVWVEAEEVRFGPGGEASFWTGGRLVMSYAPWAWKTVMEGS